MPKLKHNVITSFEQAKNLLGSKFERKIENNTFIAISYIKSEIVIRLHYTGIIRFTKNYIELNNSGFFTDTTQRRINQFTNANIYQKDFKWYLGNGTEYYDGIRIDYQGNVYPIFTLEYQD